MQSSYVRMYMRRVLRGFGSLVQDADAPVDPRVLEIPAIAAVGDWLFRGAHRRYLAAALGLYVFLVLSLLVWSDFLPYVTDNNESFSNILHAQNMIRFGLRSAAGLSDEATGANAAAHPYVYTHEGNFPRLPVYLLMRLGVTQVEGQIALEALLVGGLTIYLCFKFFSKIAGDLFAFIVCGVLATDYLMFMQWEVNTYRVWHGLFFFLSLVCVQALGGERRRQATWGLLATAIGLFYFEVLFAIFTTAMCVCYALLIYGRRREVVLQTAALMAGGAAIGLGGLFVQSIAHLGWATTWHDFSLTYLTRNFFSSGDREQAASSAWSFFLKHHIVWWEDVPDTRGYFDVRSFLRQLGASVLGIYTPYFMLLTWIVAVAAAVDAGTRRWRIKRHGVPPPSVTVQHVALAMTAAAIIAYAVVSLAASGRAGLPVFPSRLFIAPDAWSIALTVGIVFLVFPEMPRFFWMRWGDSWDGSSRSAGEVRLLASGAMVPVQRWVSAGAFLIVVTAFALNHWRVYGAALAAIWLDAIEGFFNTDLLRIVLIGSVALFLIVLLRGRRYLRPRGHRAFAGIIRYVGAGAAAYLCVYLLAPGYLLVGYLLRYAPLPVFVVDVWIALFFYLLVQIAWGSARELVKGRDGRGVLRPVGTAAAVFTLSVFLLLFAGAYWARIQAFYFTKIPPTGLAFASVLRGPEYFGAPVVSNTYAAPFAFYTKAWAYFDPIVAANRYTAANGEIRQEIMGTYLFQADRESNQAYMHPQYYICMHLPTLVTVAELLEARPGSRPAHCSAQPIVREARSGGRFRNVVTAQDHSSADLWAIVRLDPALRFVRLR